ncbi:hypothetical protein BDV3_003788 [Batrachochytrium dendrobatidis]
MENAFLKQGITEKLKRTQSYSQARGITYSFAKRIARYWTANLQNLRSIFSRQTTAFSPDKYRIQSLCHKKFKAKQYISSPKLLCFLPRPSCSIDSSFLQVIPCTWKGERQDKLVFDYSRLGPITHFVSTCTLISPDGQHDLSLILSPHQVKKVYDYQKSQPFSWDQKGNIESASSFNLIGKDIADLDHESTTMREYADIEKSSHSSLSQTIHHNPSSMPTSFNANPEMLHLNTSTQATTGTSMTMLPISVPMPHESNITTTDTLPYLSKPHISQPYPGNNVIQTLFGSTLSACFRLLDLNGQWGAYFLFPEICLRLEGLFALKFTIHDVMGCTPDSPKPAVISVITQPFRSYNPRTYPGMQVSPPLVHHFFMQGAPLLVRSKVPTKKKTFGSPTKEEN